MPITFYERNDFTFDYLYYENQRLRAENAQLRRENDALEKQAGWQPIPSGMRDCGLAALAVPLGVDAYGSTIYMRTFGYQSNGFWYNVHTMLVHPVAYIPIPEYNGGAQHERAEQAACG